MSEHNQDQPNEDMVEEVAEKLQEQTDPRLAKAVDMLIKTTGIDKQKLKDKTLEEQFDLLSFYADNVPKPKNVPIQKNKPVVPVPTNNSTEQIGRMVKDVQGNYMLFKSNEWIKNKRG